MLTLLGLSLLLLSLALCAAGYLFAAYVMFRVGEKFRVGRYRDYLVPVWNLALLCDCGGVTRLVAAGLALPAPLFWIICAAGAPSLEFYAGRALAALFVFCWVYLWGSVAERLGKSFWLWGAACLVFGGVPVLFLAFDGSMPRR
ncbi:hypothetical protein [uncultured Cloacibacillus sp.]|mgnify:CR=1 FL=1|uniref:hypothetical protein n=1 Tax=uncultured Cloacibacillus sp. TaxID=889794 RepID=UPI0025EFF146|nr:hypothetical protein [uncultured Cloacibacillus sp.]